MAREIHFLVRYSDKLKGVDTIAEHRAVATVRGAVWFGKFGVGSAAMMINKAKNYISNIENYFEEHHSPSTRIYLKAFSYVCFFILF